MKTLQKIFLFYLQGLLFFLVEGTRPACTAKLKINMQLILFPLLLLDSIFMEHLYFLFCSLFRAKVVSVSLKHSLGGDSVAIFYGE